MKKIRYYGCFAAGAAGLILLFLLNFCYIFAALGLLAFGLAAFPSVLLGAAGVIHITTDLPFPSLLSIGAGALLLGFGMCLGSAAVCPASVRCLYKFTASLEKARKRLKQRREG